MNLTNIQIVTARTVRNTGPSSRRTSKDTHKNKESRSVRTWENGAWLQARL